MWGDIITTAFITVIIMLVLHHTYIHMQSMLTVPKVSDLVRRPVQKYAEIDKLVAQAAPPLAQNRMPEGKSELKTFLKNLRH